MIGQTNRDADKQITQYNYAYKCSVYPSIIYYRISWLLSYRCGAITLDPSHTEGEGQVLEPFYEKLGSYLVVYKYFRSKYVCIIVGNSVKSVIYYRRTGILRTKYRITMGVGCKICSASYSIDGDIYYTFYRISCYHAYRFRPETSPGRNQVFQKGVQVLYFPPPLCVMGPK